MIKQESFKHYICGLVDGEGSFSISIQVDPTHKNRLRIKPAFSIGLHKDDIKILKQIKNVFKCGTIRDIDNISKYEVGNILDLITIVIPFFEKYPLRAKKSDDFNIFKQICHLIKNKIHLTPEGFNNIIMLRSEMNKTDNRRKNVILNSWRGSSVGRKLPT